MLARSVRKGNLVAAGLAVVATLAAACSSGSSGGTSPPASTGSNSQSPSAAATASAGVAWANDLLQKYSHQVVANFPRPTTPITPGTHKVGMVFYSLSSTTSKNEYNVMKQALSTIGWSSLPPYDGKLSAATEAAGIENALSRGAEALFLFSMKPQDVQNALQPALDKKMPVICLVCGQPSDPGNLPGVTIVQDSLTLGGQLAAAYIIADSNGQANVSVFNDKEFPNVVDRISATVAALKQYCPGCKVSESDVIETQAIAPGVPSFLGYLSAHPKGTVNYIVAPYDAAASVWAPAAAQAGRSEIKIIGYFNSPPMSSYLTKGDPPTAAASIAAPLDYYAWAAVDIAARLLNGKPTWNTLDLPNALITHANASEFAASMARNGGEPSVDPNFDVKTYFAKMWGKG